jgi:hypothetical protein
MKGPSMTNNLPWQGYDRASDRWLMIEACLIWIGIPVMFWLGTVAFWVWLLS